MYCTAVLRSSLTATTALTVLLVTHRVLLHCGPFVSLTTTTALRPFLSLTATTAALRSFGNTHRYYCTVVLLVTRHYCSAVLRRSLAAATALPYDELIFGVQYPASGLVETENVLTQDRDGESAICSQTPKGNGESAQEREQRASETMVLGEADYGTNEGAQELEPPHLTESTESPKSLETIESIESIDPVDSTESIETAESIETNETIGSIDSSWFN